MQGDAASKALVAFVVPAYNASATIGRSLQSLLNQTCANWQAIVVDDGSADDTAEVAGKIAEADRRVVVVRQPNRGVANARNTGIDNANARYVAFLDADDRVSNRFVEAIEDALASDDGCVFVSNVVLEPDGVTLDTPAERLQSDAFLEAALSREGFSFACWRFAFPLASVNDGGVRFTSGRAFGEDQEFSLIALVKSDGIAPLDPEKATYYYNNSNEGSATHHGTALQFDFVLAMDNVVKEARSENEMSGKLSLVVEYLEARRADALNYACSQALRNGASPSEVASQAKRAIRECRSRSMFKKRRADQDATLLRLWSISPRMAVDYIRKRR